MDASPIPEANRTSENNEKAPERIFLYSYPKIVLLYPTLLTAFLAGLVMWLTGNASGTDRPLTEGVAILFLITTGINLVVFAFDFPRT
ncbi:MAG: hypothetical protein ACKVT0_19175, partial [Planctomycetaceae bacterium]